MKGFDPWQGCFLRLHFGRELKEKPTVEIIVTLHGRLANTVWLFLLILGLWSLWRAIRGEGLSGNFLGALAIGQVLIYVQAIMGGILFMGGESSNLLSPPIW